MKYDHLGVTVVMVMHSTSTPHKIHNINAVVLHSCSHKDEKWAWVSTLSPFCIFIIYRNMPLTKFLQVAVVYKLWSKWHGDGWQSETRLQVNLKEALCKRRWPITRNTFLMSGWNYEGNNWALYTCISWDQLHYSNKKIVACISTHSFSRSVFIRSQNTDAEEERPEQNSSNRNEIPQNHRRLH